MTLFERHQKERFLLEKKKTFGLKLFQGKLFLILWAYLLKIIQPLRIIKIRNFMKLSLKIFRK